MKYGIPYMGSKRKLAHKLLSYIPAAKNFYDLFGGGFSVTHYAVSERSNKWQNFYFNEIQSDVVDLIKKAINGEYNYNVFKPEFIDKERFFKEKDKDAYIKILWSFGNNQRTYLFGPDIEQQKKSLHNAVVFNQFDSFASDIFGFSDWGNTKYSITQRRMILKSRLRMKGDRLDLQALEQLERLQQLEQLERLQQLERLEHKINFTSLSYDKVTILPDSVIYCDPPYNNTAEYAAKFDYEKFYQWADSIQCPVFISEYNMDKRFVPIASFTHTSILSAINKAKQVEEKLFINKFAKENIPYFKGIIKLQKHLIK